MRRLVLVLFAAVVVVPGCSGDGDELSFDEWVEAVNALCAAMPDPDTEPTVAADFPPLAAEIAEQGKELKADVEALGPPDERHDAAEAWQDQLDQGIAAFDRLAAAAPEDLGEIEEAFDAAVDTQAELDERSEGLGLDDCAAEDDAPGDGAVVLDDELGPVGSAYAQGLAEEGIEIEKATCIARHVLETVGSDRLVELSIEASETPEGEEPPAELIEPTIAGAQECGALDQLLGAAE